MKEQLKFFERATFMIIQSGLQVLRKKLGKTIERIRPVKKLSDFGD